MVRKSVSYWVMKLGDVQKGRIGVGWSLLECEQNKNWKFEAFNWFQECYYIPSIYLLMHLI